MQGLAADATPAAVRWRAAAAAVLRRAGREVGDGEVAQALGRTTVEDIAIPVLGSAVASNTLTAPAGWDLRALLTEADPARLSDELSGGAHSVWLLVGGAGIDPTDLPTLAAKIPETVPLVLEPDDDLDDTALARTLVGRGPGTSLGADPLSRRLRGRPGRSDVLETARCALDLGIGAVVVDGTAAHERGAGDTCEIGYCLAVAVAYLRAWTEAGIDVDTAFDLLSFRYAVTDEQFLSIAKIRAAQLLWGRIRDVSGVAAGRQIQHAVTSRLMFTRFDAWTNLLRSTVATFAAAVAGADALTVLPYDAAAGRSDATAQRLARAVVHVLHHESHLDRSDPAAGAGALEGLTEAYADAAWAEFQHIEGAGGAAAALTELPSRWEATAAERRARIADGRQQITGITTFRRTEERPPQRPPLSAGDRFADLSRWADALENTWNSE